MAERTVNKNETPYHTGMAERIREAAKEMNSFGPFSRDDLINRLDLWSWEMGAFNTVLFDMRGRGELVSLGYAAYLYNEKSTPCQDVRSRILRAMYIKGAFCTVEIRKLTDADNSYISATIRKLVKAGYLEPLGKSAKGNIFRVKHKDVFYQKLVRGKYQWPKLSPKQTITDHQTSGAGISQRST